MGEKITVCPLGSSKRVVVALGGNAILQSHQKGTAEEQLENVFTTCRHIVEMIKEGHKVVITHGNGPQVGNILIQQEVGEAKVPALPMDICGAMSQGQIGYMLQQTLHNLFRAEGMNKDILAVATQVMVDKEDPGFQNPTKPVGPFYDLEAKKLNEKKGYIIKEVKPGNSSPLPPGRALPKSLENLRGEGH